MRTSSNLKRSVMDLRISKRELKALKKALEGFEGEVYVFGSRLNLNKKGGDIDILLVPKGKVENTVKLAMEVQVKYFKETEEDIDVLVYREGEPFFQEILKHAKRLDLEAVE